MKVNQAIGAVSREIAATGIAKGRYNEQQRYAFRGIDDVLNALGPIMAKHGLFILPRVLARTVTERTTQKGGVLFYVVVEAEFDFTCAEDGSKITARTIGEAMDSGDKATNKAMSAAYKYAALMTFSIPTEGDNDADAVTHQDVQPQADAEQVAKLNACVTMDQLSAFWKSITPADRKLLAREKDRRKSEIESEQAEAA